MSIQQLIVVGGSAGATDVLVEIARALPRDLPAAIAVVLHLSPESPGIIPTLLSSAGVLPAELAADKQPLEHGRIYVAPPDHHLLVEPDRLRLTRGPKENRFRPAVDPLFRSAAQVYGPRVIGVVLTGGLDDGTAGLWTIKQLGGIAIVQDPADAVSPSMPASALEHVAVDYCVAAAELGPLLVRLTATPVHERPLATRSKTDVEVDIASGQNARLAGVEDLGTPSNFACPDCHGVLLAIEEGGRTRFRCYTGHAYSVSALLASIHEGIEDAIWNAIRALDEGSRLMQHMSDHQVGRDAGAALQRQAEEAFRDAETLRGVVERRGERMQER